jgi:hypothetical protein
LLPRVPADGEVSGPKGPPWELRDGDIFQCMTASTSLAHAAARQCSLCEQGLAPIEVRCRHSNASRAALWLQRKHCAAARSLCSKGDITIELAGRLFLLADDRPGSSKATTRGCSRCCARHRYWLLGWERMVHRTYLGAHWCSRCQRNGLLSSGFSVVNAARRAMGPVPNSSTGSPF